jgi:hypothetical protein
LTNNDSLRVKEKKGFAMKNINVMVISKGRKYYKCKLNDKYDCKVISDKELQIGDKYNLVVDDISVRSKFGTDLIFTTVAQANESEGVVTLKTRNYNSDLVDKCRKLAGIWDASEKAWVFKKIVENEVEELDYLYNSDIVKIEKGTKSGCYRQVVTIWRWSLAHG